MKFKCGLSKTAIHGLVSHYAPDGLSVDSVRKCYFGKNKRWYALEWGLYSADVFAWDGQVRVVYYCGREKFFECLADLDYLVSNKLCA